MNYSEEQLESLIVELDTLYDDGEDCVNFITGQIVADSEYDALKQQLYKLNPNSTIFLTPTASKSRVIKKVVHNPPLTSLSKAFHQDKVIQRQLLDKWLEHGLQVAVSYKLDGIACALYYENGYLISAGLRPRDGINGEDITEQIKYVLGVKTRLPFDISCSIRGEIICTYENFKTVQEYLKESGEKIRANPRNHAAGGIRQFKEPKKTELMGLSFIGHGVENFDNPPYETEIERSEWCRNVLQIPFVWSGHFGYDDLESFEFNKNNLEYEVDGLVLSVNNLALQKEMGQQGDSPTGNPRGKIAWKFSEEVAVVTLIEIEWRTGRTGVLKPVAIFEGVQLAGTVVSRATLHNLGFIKRNGIKVGSQLKILKAGKIIPKVIGVVDVEGEVGEVVYPLECPSCGFPTDVNEGKHEICELVCNNKDCNSQGINGFLYFLRTIGVLGIGESIVTTLLEFGKVKQFSDFYKLTADDFEDCGFRERESFLSLCAIHMAREDCLEESIRKKKKIAFGKFVAALGIETVGLGTSRSLLTKFKNLDSLRKASFDDLLTVPNIGTVTASNIVGYFKDNSELVDDLLNFIELEYSITASGLFSGKTFVLTGVFEKGKKFWETVIESHGGIISGSVSKKTHYVLAGVDAGLKLDKAKLNNIHILSVDDLQRML